MLCGVPMLHITMRNSAAVRLNLWEMEYVIQPFNLKQKFFIKIQHFNRAARDSQYLLCGTKVIHQALSLKMT